MKFGYAPWPEFKKRKINVGANIPPHDVKIRFGIQHTIRQSEAFVEE